MKQQRQYPKVMITSKAERSVKNGHPWIYGEEIQKMDGEPQNGGLADVFAGNAFMGTGFYNSASKITVRLISRNANDVYRLLRPQCGPGLGGACDLRGHFQPAVDIAIANSVRNGVADKMDFLCADLFDLLTELAERKCRDDFIILDPPAFTKSRSTVNRLPRVQGD